MTITEVCVEAKKLGMDYGAYVYKYKPSGSSRTILREDEKECPECGKIFFPTNDRQKFCGASCRGRANQKKRAVTHDARIKYRVEQYDMDGNFIEAYNSLNKAARAMNTYGAAIRNAAQKGEPLCGYKWLFADPGTIQQYDIDGRLIAEYDTLQQAEEASGINRDYIRDCLNGKQGRTNGFIWRYSTDDRKPTYGVMQCSTDGQVIKCWITMRDAEHALDLTRGSISRVIHGERQTAGGFVWKKAVPTEIA